MTEEKRREIIVIGLGASGLYSSKAALNQDRTCHVTIIEMRDFDQFSPCGLPFVLEGMVDDFEELKHVVPEVKGRLDKLLGYEVIKVDPEAKTVTARELSSGLEKVMAYDSLILSNGARPINLPIPGSKEFVGKGLSYAVLDPSTFVGKRTLIVGGGDSAVDNALLLKSFYKSRGARATVLITNTPETLRQELEHYKSRGESFDRMIFLGRASLDRAIAEYVAQYHEERAHQGLGNELISGRRAAGKATVVASERLGGLLKYYHREA